MKIKYLLVLTLFYLKSTAQTEAISNGYVFSEVDFMTTWYKTIFHLSEAEAATVSARGLAYIDIAFYETAIIASPHHVSMSEQLNGLKIPKHLIQKRGADEYFAPIAINLALRNMAVMLFNTAHSRLLRNVVIHADSIETHLKEGLDKQVYWNSREIGDRISEHLLKWARLDGGHNVERVNIFHTNIKNCDSCWQYNERSLKFGGPLTPNWGNNRLFIKADSLLNISPKVQFSSDVNSTFYQEAMEVYRKSKASTNSFFTYNEEEKLADFWNDASNLDDAYTPATHSHSILMQCFEKDLRLTMPEIAESFCKLGIGLSDAFVVCWREKYNHYLLRPDTYIKRYIDKNWLPFITTPQFPEFPSGHSTQIGAFETIMADFFGKDFSFTDNRQYRGIKKFSSFSKVAEEVVEARILGGMHYRFSSEQGRELGNLVGENTLKLIFKKKN